MIPATARPNFDLCKKQNLSLQLRGHLKMPKESKTKNVQNSLF